jgi:hypothetical protein
MPGGFEYEERFFIGLIYATFALPQSDFGPKRWVLE